MKQSTKNSVISPEREPAFPFPLFISPGPLKIHLQNTLSLSVASSSPPCTSLLAARQVRDLPLSFRVGMKVNIDVELFPSSES